MAISLTGCRGDGNATNENNFDCNSATATIKGFNIKEISDLVIPSQIDGTDVREIGVRVFRNVNLTSVEIPSGVEGIGVGAFRINNLTSVEIPDSVKAIKNSAFVGNNLTSVELPAGVDLPPGRRKAFDGDLKEVYNENNNEEGIYVRDDLNSGWYKQE